MHHFGRKVQKAAGHSGGLEKRPGDGVILKFTHTCVNRYITKSACEWLRSHRERMTLKRKKEAKTEPWGVRHERDRGRQPEMVRKRRCGAQAMCQACALGPARGSAAHGLQPARLLCPWDSPDKNTGEGCRFLLQQFFPAQG